MSLRRPIVRSLRLATAGGAAALTAAACGAQANSTTVPVRAPTKISIGQRTVGRPVPGGFVGLSMEYRGLAAYAGTNPRAIDPPFLNLVRSLAPGQHPVLRIGGDSTDWTWWPVPGVRRPGGIRLDLTPTSMAVTKAVAQDLDAKLILGINMEADSTRVAAAEAQAFVSRVGAASIGALEIGNEAELYPSFNWYRTAAGVGVRGRPPGYGFSGMVSDFSRMAAVMPNVPLAGPSSGAKIFLPYLGTFLAREPKVKLATVHAYPLKHCTGSAPVTEPQLLADSASDGLGRIAAPWVAASHRRGVPIRVDEMNAITCGGAPGISNTYGSALWALDTMFAMAHTGVDGVNLHTRPGAINAAFDPVLRNGQWSMIVRPEFYGLLMFAQAVPAGSRLLSVTGGLPTGLKVWAVRAPDHSIRVVVINKLSRRAMTVPLSLEPGHGTATIEWLRGRSLTAAGGVTLGGQSFGAATTTGQLGAPHLSSVAPVGQTYSVTVPAASAALITVHP